METTSSSSTITQQNQSAATATISDRSALLGKAAALGIQSAHGLQATNEQQLSQILTDLVRSKLLSADDSYRLRDAFSEPTAIRNLIDQRIAAIAAKRLS